MKYKIYLTSNFLSNLENIFNFYRSKNNLTYYFKLLDKVENAVNSLEELPERFAIIPEISFYGDINIRHFIVDKYRIIYKIEKYNISILGIISQNLLNLSKVLLNTGDQ
jgi:hypothetical protein